MASRAVARDTTEIVVDPGEEDDHKRRPVASPPRTANASKRSTFGRARAIAALVGALALLVIVSTIWTAAGLEPVVMATRAAVGDWTTPQDGAELPKYELVSESFLLMQLARAFLAAPWMLPDAGSSRTLRTEPSGGWGFPVLSDEGEAADEGEVRRRLPMPSPVRTPLPAAALSD